MHHGDFYSATLKEYDLITKAKIKAKNAEIEARRVLNQELGVLVQFAFHEPKKMPDFTKEAGRKPQAQKVVGGAEGAAHLRLYLDRMCSN